MTERQLVRDFENNHLFIQYPDLYKYDYPDTGKRAFKQKPPDSLYLWNGYSFLIEYKTPGNPIKPHQIKQLLDGRNAGALAFIGTIYPSSKSIMFVRIDSPKVYELQYDNGYKDFDKLLYNLRRLYNDGNK